MAERVCVVCGVSFVTRHSRKMTCSEDCMNRHKSNLTSKLKAAKSKATYCRACGAMIKPAGITGEGRKWYCVTCKETVKKENNIKNFRKYLTTDKGVAYKARQNKKHLIKRYDERGGYSDAYMRHVDVSYVSHITGVDEARVAKIRTHVESQAGERIDKDDLIEFVIHRELLRAIKKAGE